MKKNLLYILLVTMVFPIYAQNLVIDYSLDGGEVSANGMAPSITQYFVMEWDDIIPILNESFGDNSDLTNFNGFYVWQKSYDAMNWEMVTPFPDPSLIWYPDYPEDGIDPQNLIYYNPEISIDDFPQYVGNNPILYFRRLVWNGGTYQGYGNPWHVGVSNTIKLYLSYRLNSGEIAPAKQIRPDGSDPIEIYSAIDGFGVYGAPVVYQWEHSTDNKHWTALTPVPVTFPDNTYLNFTPSNTKGVHYYRRLVYDNVFPDFPAQSNSVLVHNVFIESAGTIKENPVSCDIRYVNLIQDNPIEYSGDGTTPCSFIHGYEISYNNGTTWESTQLASGQSFSVTLPYGQTFQIRRWVQDPYDEIAGTKKYSNIFTKEASTSGTIVDASDKICQGNGTSIKINNSSLGSYYNKQVLYQWAVSSNNSVFIDIPGATGTSLTYIPSTYSPELFFQRKMYISGCSPFYSIPSNTIEIDYPKALDGGIISSSDNIYCYEESIANLNVTDNNEGRRDVVYIWQAAPVDGSVDWERVNRVVNNTIDTEHDLDLTTMRRQFYDWSLDNGGVKFRRYIWDIANNCKSYSNIYSITTYPEINPGSVGYDEIICSSFEVSDIPSIEQTSVPSGGDGSYTYSWEFKNEGEETWNVIAGATSSKLDISALPENTKTYRRKVHDLCLSENEAEYTNEVTHTYKDITIDGMLENVSECSGTLHTFSANTGYTKYEWNLNDNVFVTGSANYSKVIEETDESLALKVTDSDGCEAETEVTLEGFSLPSYNMPDIHICDGNSEIVTAPEGFTDYYFDSEGPFSENTTEITYSEALSNQNRTVKVIDENGCTNGDVTYKAYPVQLPVVNLVDDYVCYGNSKTIAIQANPSITNITWEDSEGNVLASSPTSYSITVNPLETTEYSVTVENEYCSVTKTMTMTVRDNPSFALNDTFACYNSNLVLTAKDNYPYHYWSTNNGFENVSTQFNVQNDLTVSLRVVDAYSCESTESMNISMKPLPVVSVATVQGCVGNDVTLTAPEGYGYLWETGETSQAILREVMPFNHPDNQVGLTVNDGWGCKATTTASINPLPTPETPSISTQYVCEGEDHTITSNRVYNSYLWSTGETTKSITVNYNQDQTLKLKVGNEYGCFDSTSFAVIVNEIPVFDITDKEKCNDGNLFSITSPIVESGLEYYWSNGSVGQYAQFNLTNSSSLWLEITKGICSYRDTFYVQLNQLPNVTLPDTNICNGDSLKYTYQGDFEDYLWSNGQTGPTIKTKITASQNISLTVEDEKGCIGSGIMEVIRLQLPTVYITSESSVCEGEEVDLSVPASFPNILWSTGETSPVITKELYEDSDFSVTVRDVNGCMASAQTSIAANPIPVGTLEDTSVCDGDYTILTQPGNFILNWSTGATGNNIIFRPSNSVTVYLTLTDGNNCVGYDSMYIEVIDIPMINIPNSEVCQGDSVRIESPIDFENMLWSTGDTTTYTYVKPVNDVEYVSFTYSDIHGCGSVVNTRVDRLEVTPFSINPQSICMGENTVLSAQLGFVKYLWSTGATTSSITVEPEETTVYYVDVTDGNGCKAHKETYVEVNNLPEFGIDDQFICPGLSITLAGPVGNYSYKWSNGSTSRYINLLYTNPGDYNLKVTDRTTNCSSTDYFNVEAVQEPGIDFSDTTLCMGQSITYMLPAPYQYIWYDGIHEGEKIISPLSDTYFTIGIVDTFGCTTNRDFNVIVYTAPILEIDDIIMCNGSISSLNVPYSPGFVYNWSNGDNKLTTTYEVGINEVMKGWVKAISSNCEVSDTFKIISESLPELKLEDKVICENDSILVKIPEGLVYNWSTGDTVNSIYLNDKNLGNVYVELTTKYGACQKVYQFKTSIEKLNISFSADSTEIYLGSDINLTADVTGSSANLKYSWFIEGESFTGNNLVFTPSQTGKYDVSLNVESANGCSTVLDMENYITVLDFNDTNRIGLDKIEEHLHVLIYPNPSYDYVYIDTKVYDLDNEIEIALFDITGKAIKSQQIVPGSVNKVSLEGLPEGSYFVKLNVNGFVKTAKIIKAK